MNREEKIERLKKFTLDRDWYLMEEILKEHLSPLVDVMTIDETKSNDQIASEVRGRQLTIKGLTNFLNDTKIIKGSITKKETKWN